MRCRGYPLICVLLLSTMLGTAPTVSQNRQFRVVVNNSNPVTSLSRDQLSKIFLKRVDRWNDGQRTAPVDLAPDSPVRDAFSRAVHRRSAARINSYWQQQIYSGAGVPPSQRDSESAVLDFVRSHPGAVGYISSRSSGTGGVKVISVTGL